MGNNERPTRLVSSKTIPNDMSIVPHEDLSIVVDLQTVKRSRVEISTYEGNGYISNYESSNGETINFISGSDYKGGRSLTTNYTNIGNYKEGRVILNKSGEDLEGLGITNIDISFNSSYAPQIVINFIDIRGAAILEQGMESKYSSFFSIPYPIFKLTIKGYYGQAVTYCLHLVKWNARFNSDTGNFEIKCEFIGHTYAFLTDMLVGYLAAVVETPNGKRILTEKKNKKITLDDINNGFNGIEGDPYYPGLMSISELKATIANLNTEIQAIKSDNEVFKEISLTNNKIQLLENIKEVINNQIKNKLVNSINLNEFSNNCNKYSDNIYILNDNQSSDEVSIINDAIKDISIIIKEYNINIEDSNDKLYDNDFSLDGFKYYEGTISNFLDNVGPKKKDNANKNNIETPVNDFVTESLTDNYSDNWVFILNINFAINKINEKITNLNNKLEVYNNDASTLLKTRVSSEINFKPSIKNIIGILANHVDIFMMCIRDVVNDCEKSSSRVKDFTKYLKNIDISEQYNTSKIFPFPGYDNDGIEAWIGNVLPNIPEVIFIEELLRGFLVVEKNKQDLQKELLSGTNNTWYPISLLDTTLFNATNPYKTKRIVEAISEQIIINEIIKRSIMFSHFTNTKIREDELRTMASIEAQTVISSLENEKIKQRFNNLTYESMLSGIDKDLFYTSDIFNELIGPIIKIKGSVKFDEQPDAGIAGRYLPFESSTFNNTILDNNTTYLKIITEEKYNSQSNFKAYDTPQGYESNSGSIIIDLDESIKRNLYLDDNKNNNQNYYLLDTKLKLPEFFEVKIKNGDESFFSDGLFWSNYYLPLSNSLTNPKSGNQMVVYNEFRYNGITDNITKPHISFQVTDFDTVSTISLFGSELYYKQSDNLFINHKENKSDVCNKSRALLFLHCLPFDGLVGNSEYGLFSEDNDEINSTNDNTLLIPDFYADFISSIVGSIGFYTYGKYKRNLFNKRGGFIKVPKSWLLLLGGLLWRYTGVKSGNLITDPIRFYKYGTEEPSNFYIPYIEDKSQLPSYNTYLKYKTSKFYNFLSNSEYANEPMKFGNIDSYVNIEDTLLKLPTQAKDELINLFNEWVSEENGWVKIRNAYEIEEIFENGSITEYNSAIIARQTLFNNFIYLINNQQLFTLDFAKYLVGNNKYYDDSNEIFQKTVIPMTKILKSSDSFKDKEIIKYISPNIESYNYNYKTYNYDITFNKVEDIDIWVDLINPLIVGNTTWRIWCNNSSEINEYNGYYTDEFYISNYNLKIYLDTFLQEYKKIFKNNTNIDNINNLKQDAFGTINNDIIKLNLYRTIKAIHDKWISGTKQDNGGIANCVCSGYQPLINSFRFLNKAFVDIGDEFLINPNTINTELQLNTNQSFYDLVSRILVANNFDFIPLPTYIDYRDEDQISKIFTPIPYKDYVNNTTVGPTFICMYSGQPSKNLDIDNNGYKSESIDFNNYNSMPKEFFKDSQYTIPVFSVDYSQGNQSIFKEIKLDQSEFSETDESLQIIDEISFQGERLNRTHVGQNLFNVYSTRSYQSEIDCLGNAMIQPMMYYQLNNIPMFRGGYLITRVNHSIKPNNMLTSFRGVRVSKIMTPLISEGDLYMNMIGSLSDLDISKTSLRSISDSDFVNTANNNTPDLKYNFVNPIKGTIIITSPFGSPREKGPHIGVDLDVKQGITELIAISDGYINLIKINTSGYGLYLQLMTDLFENYKFSVNYGHLSDLSPKILNIIKNNLSNEAKGKNLTSIQDLEYDIESINKIIGGVYTNIRVNKGEVIGIGGGLKSATSSKLYKTKDTIVNLAGAGSTGSHLHIDIRDITNGGNKLCNPSKILLLDGKYSKDLSPKENIVRDEKVITAPKLKSSVGTLDKLGLERNNPLSLRKTPRKEIDWDGVIYPQQSILSFIDIYYGLRAGIINITNKRKELKTYEEFIYEYASPNENDTELYLSKIISEMGNLGVNISRNDNIQYKNLDIFTKFIKVIAKLESSSNINTAYIKELINIDYDDIFKSKYDG